MRNSAAHAERQRALPIEDTAPRWHDACDFRAARLHCPPRRTGAEAQRRTAGERLAARPGWSKTGYWRGRSFRWRGLNDTEADRDGKGPLVPSPPVNNRLTGPEKGVYPSYILLQSEWFPSGTPLLTTAVVARVERRRYRIHDYRPVAMSARSWWTRRRSRLRPRTGPGQALRWTGSGCDRPVRRNGDGHENAQVGTNVSR